jgi:hypothetical protein
MREPEQELLPDELPPEDVPPDELPPEELPPEELAPDELPLDDAPLEEVTPEELPLPEPLPLPPPLEVLDVQASSHAEQEAAALAFSAATQLDSVAFDWQVDDAALSALKFPPGQSHASRSLHPVSRLSSADAQLLRMHAMHAVPVCDPRHPSYCPPVGAVAPLQATTAPRAPNARRADHFMEVMGSVIRPMGAGSPLDSTAKRVEAAYCGGGSEHTSLMHVVPLAAPQQSLVFVHLSPSCEQPLVVDEHTSVPASPAAAPASPPAPAQ